MFGRFFKNRKIRSDDRDEEQQEEKSKPNYTKFQGLEKLGDRAFSAKQYDTALEYYRDSLKEFNIPNNPKYIAVLEKIKEVENQVSKNPLKATKTNAVDGIIIPTSIQIRLFFNRNPPNEEWDKFVWDAFISSMKNDSDLIKIAKLDNENCKKQISWKKITYFGSAFDNIVIEQAKTFFDSIIADSDSNFFRTFIFDINLPRSEAQGKLLVLVLGNNLA